MSKLKLYGLQFTIGRINSLLTLSANEMMKMDFMSFGVSYSDKRLRHIVVGRQFLTSELSLSDAQLMGEYYCLLQISQLGHLSLSFFQGR